MTKPLFASREEFDSSAQAAGLNATNCAYVALNSLVDFTFGGIDISSESAVIKACQSVDYLPGSVAVNNSGSTMSWSSEVGCRACKMTVTVIGGYSDFQNIGLEKNSARLCPIFDKENPRLSDDELFADDFIRTGERLGCYVECFGYEDASDGSKKYYALVMPKDQYDKLLQDENQRREEYAEFHHVSFSPWACLPWEVQIDQPTFTQGHGSRKEALLASMQAMLRQKKKKA